MGYYTVIFLYGNLIRCHDVFLSEKVRCIIMYILTPLLGENTFVYKHKKFGKDTHETVNTAWFTETREEKRNYF